MVSDVTCTGPSEALLGPFVSEGVLDHVGWEEAPVACGRGGWPMTRGAPAPEAWGFRTQPDSRRLTCFRDGCPLPSVNGREPCLPKGN